MCKTLNPVYYDTIIRTSIDDPDKAVELFLSLNKDKRKAALRHMLKQAFQEDSNNAYTRAILCINAL
jgi:hypothetical protein